MTMLKITNCPSKTLASLLYCRNSRLTATTALGCEAVIRHRRYNSTINSKKAGDGAITIYTGPLANVAKKLKLFSITSLGLGVGASPFIFAVDVPVPFVAKAALVGAAIVTSAASTGLIQWVMSPYVTKITVSPDDLPTTQTSLPQKLNIHTLSFTAKDYVTTVPVNSIQPATRIFTSWMVSDLSQATGRIGDKRVKPRALLYVHPEVCESGEAGLMKEIVSKTGIGKGF